MLKREERAWLVSFIVVVGFAGAVFFHYWLGYYRGLPYPKNTFLFIPSDHSMDFFNLFNPVQTGHPYSYQWSIYFPFAFIPFSLFSFLPARIVHLAFLSIFIGWTVGFLYKHLKFLPHYERPTATFILSFLSYPFLICIDRGNFECLLFVFLCLFFANYQQGNLKRSVFYLACAIAMKAYPGVLVVLFLARKQYKAAIATVVLAILLTVLSAAVYPGGVVGSFQGLANNLGHYKQDYIVGDGALAFGSSYFGPLKIIVRKFHPMGAAAIDPFILLYTLTCLAGFALASIYIVFRERTFWKQVAILSFAMILLPTVSAEYKLIHILFPLAFFLASPQNEKRERLYAVLFGLLLVPKAFFWLRDDISISVILNPLLMTTMILLIVLDGLSVRGKARHGEPLPVRLATNEN